MKTSIPAVPACRYCRHFTPEGRRGGSCRQLGATVKGSWKSCSLALPVFTSTWKEFEEAVARQQEVLTATGTAQPCGARVMAMVEPQL